MSTVHYVAIVKDKRTIELPVEADELHLRPGQVVHIQVEQDPTAIDPAKQASIALLESWIAQAPTDPEEIRAAEEDLNELKRNLNQPRKEAGARLLFPEVE